MFDSQLYPFVGRNRRLPLRDNNGRCVNQEGKHELHMIINFGREKQTIFVAIGALRVNYLFQKEGYKNMIEVTHPLFMKLFEEALQSNGGSYLVGESVRPKQK